MKVNLMRVTRNSFGPVGKMVYDHFRKMTSRREALTAGLDAEGMFDSVEQASEWIKNHGL